MGDRRRSPSEAFGQVLRKLRVQKGLTQEALALEAGTERSHISSLERAERGPSLGTIFKLARALGTSSGELVSMAEDVYRQKKR